MIVRNPSLKTSGHSLNIRSQLAVLAILLSVMLDCSLYYKWDTMLHSKLLVGGFVVLVNVVSIIVLIYAVKTTDIHAIIENPNENKKAKLLFLIMIVAYAIIASLFFKTIPQYDSAEYFSEISLALDKIHADPISILDAFSIIGKQMQLFSIIVIPFLVMFNCAPIGMYIMNTILVAIAMGSVFEIVKALYVDIEDAICVIIAFVFGMFPFVFTGITYINPDFYCAVFFPIMVFCYLKDYKLFFIYTAAVFCCMKTNMIVTYGMFLFVMEIDSFFSKERFKAFLRQKKEITIIIPLIIAIYLKYGRTVQGWAQQSARAETPLLEELKVRLLQEFVYGFKWIIILLMLIVILLPQDKLIKSKKPHRVCVAVIVASVSQILVYTYLHKTKLSTSPRYWAIDALMYTLLIGYILNSVHRKQIKVFIVSALACIITIQQFYNIDPIMHYTCKEIQFRYRSVYIMTPNDYYETIGIGDQSAYNMQYSAWNSIWQDIACDGLFTNDTIIYSALDNQHEDISYYIRYGINGFELIDWYIDNNKKTIVYKPGPNTVKLSIENLSSEDEVLNLISTAPEEIVLVTPDTVTFDVETILLNNGYSLEEDRYYENSYTSLRVQVLLKNNE